MQQNKDSKDKERGFERERKSVQDVKHEKEAATVDVEAARKQGEERQGKHGRENKGKVLIVVVIVVSMLMLHCWFVSVSE